MATRKAVAASIAAAILFSSMMVTNYVVFSGAAENFRLVSLATEERDYHVQAVTATGIAVLDLLDGAQELLSASRFNCSGVAESVANLVGSEIVRFRWGGLAVSSTLSLAGDGDQPDNLTALHPFNGSVAGSTNLQSTTFVDGGAPDGSVEYNRSEVHLLNIPLRLESLTGQCLEAERDLTAAALGLGGEMCNYSSLSVAGSRVESEVAQAASANGFSVSVTYWITSVQPCTVGYHIEATQQGVSGPQGAFDFTEQESGYLGA